MGDKRTAIQDIIGVIFDFNGTMFFDSDKHIMAWAEYIEEISGVKLTQKGIERYIADKSGKEILEHFLECELTEEMLEQFCEEKEGIYRRLCTEDRENLKLAPGLEEFLDYLTDNNVPVTIATTAHLSNVMFYFEVFDLYRWFDPEKLVCHDKSLRDKPFPDLYLVACKKINKSPDRCLVFEDSESGILAAVNAGVKNIVAVVGDNPGLDTKNSNVLCAKIKDFYELNERLEIHYKS